MPGMTASLFCAIGDADDGNRPEMGGIDGDETGRKGLGDRLLLFFRCGFLFVRHFGSSLKKIYVEIRKNA